jgi:A/G-specific adenine glycosylase
MSPIDASSLDTLRGRLAAWFTANRRDLPWREDRNPWYVWLSEVILQQTRVEQGLPYFRAFVARFPTVRDLAEADLDEVLRLWEGLGYYSRCRNLHRAAREVMTRFNGDLPATHEDWLSLPGVGPYTAAAVTSLAYGLPHAVLDGNVIRVLSRLAMVEHPTHSAAARRAFTELADAFLDRDHPGQHNEALMELGALVCTPRKPQCGTCPLQPGCAAAAAQRMEDFPVKKKGAPIPHHHIAVGIIRDAKGRIYIQQREQDAMLGGLWEFPGGKVEPGELAEAACRREVLEETGMLVQPMDKIAAIDHAYSHFRITLHAFDCALSGEPVSSTQAPHAWVTREEFSDYAFPRANRRILDLLSARSEP